MIKKIILLIIGIFIISGCTNTTTNYLIERSKDNAGVHEISYEELKNKLDSDDNFILYIGRPDCGDCQEFDPILHSFLDENKDMTLYYLNVKKFRDDSKKADATKEEKAFFDNIKEELDFNWTPTLQHIKDGKIIKAYTYLDEEFYNLDQESKEAKDKKEEFVNNFYSWMNDQFK